MKTKEILTEKAKKTLRNSNPCWKGYHPVGTKKKGGRTVPNCVPNESVSEAEEKRTMSRAAKGIMKYGKDGMKALAKAGKEGKDLDKVRDKYNKYDEAANPAQQAAIAISMKKAGKKPKHTKESVSEVFDGDKETGKTHKGGIVTKTKHGVKHTKTDYDDGNPSIGQRKEPNSRWHHTPILDKDDELDEDWQKVNKKDKTDGMSQKAVNAYRRENPGSKLKTAVTTKPSKLKKGGKAAGRRKSFCARMSGMKKAHASAKTKRDPDSPINKALRRWNCESVEQAVNQMERMLTEMKQYK